MHNLCNLGRKLNIPILIMTVSVENILKFTPQFTSSGSQVFDKKAILKDLESCTTKHLFWKN